MQSGTARQPANGYSEQPNRPAFRTVAEQIADHERRQAQRELEQWTDLDDLGILDLDLWAEDRLPAVEWMVDRHFLKGTVGLVSGDGGIGKSTLMQQLATSAVMGLPWLGCELEPGPALMLACEDDYVMLLHRHKAIVQHLGIPFHAPKEAGLQLWPRVGQDNTLMTFGKDTGWKVMGTHWWQRVALRVKRNKTKYLIIDTSTQTFDGNQNDERQVMQFITQLRQLALAMGGCVIITKHPSLSGRALGTGESGNVAWNNSVRSRFYLHKDKQKNLLWRGMKSNYGPVGEDLPLRWDRGVFVIDRPEPDYESRYQNY
jgi:RecA-family ATPase